MGRRGPPPVLRDAVFARLEGELQRLRDMPQESRPKALPVDYLARYLALSRNVVRDWVQRGRSPSRIGSDAQERFAEIYDAFCEVLAERPVTKLYEVAYNEKSPQQLGALKMLLPKLDPSTWGENAGARTGDGPGNGAADIPREVLDDLTEDELTQIEALQEQIAAAMEATAAIIAKATARVAQRATEQLVEH